MARKIASANRYRPFTGATVLEIGADKDSIAAKMLADAGAARVISTNFGENWPNDKDGAIERQVLDARRIAESFAEGSIDVVFGVAVLEHIDGLDAFFTGARHALAPGGLLYAHGGPLWTSAKGHHLGVIGHAKHYRFGNPETNPIRDWTHLTLDETRMTEDLIDRDVPEFDAKMIADFVYKSDKINRVGYRSVVESFDRSGLSLIERLDNAFKGPPPDLLDAIERGPWSGQERYDVSGVTFVARR